MEKIVQWFLGGVGNNDTKAFPFFKLLNTIDIQNKWNLHIIINIYSCRNTSYLQVKPMLMLTYSSWVTQSVVSSVIWDK